MVFVLDANQKQPMAKSIQKSVFRPASE